MSSYFSSSPSPQNAASSPWALIIPVMNIIVRYLEHLACLWNVFS
ncbi:hypothetical protein BVRB_6g133790 [Beta vulgaris subsp. vulgaris]|nr:hypothetical protein BVRB_6g133790 [Beta vulgaris subsp. vulgaris]